MIAKFINWLVNSFSKSGKQVLVIKLAIFLAAVFPVLIMSYLDYTSTKAHLKELSLSRREALARLASITLKEKFDRIVDVGVSFSTRVQFRKLIETGKWDEAIKIFESVPVDFAYIDTVTIFDSTGTLMAATPLSPSIREVIGKNFAYRDYYKGVSKNWKPYVSEVFKRAVEPKYNVVSMAIPIKSDGIEGRDSKILGILLLTIKLDTILDWAREIEVGPGGFAYFVDRNGHVAGYPKFSSQDEVVDFSELPAVKKVLQGERGVEILYNQIEKEELISAYEPVPAYGWGVIVQQPTLTAFVLENKVLERLLAVDTTIFFIAALLIYIILRFISAVNIYRQRERIYLESIGDGLVSIDRFWNIVLWNKAASLLTGWSHDEAFGRPFRDIVKFIRERDRTESIVFIEETMLFGKPHFMEPDTILIKKDGGEIYVGDSAAPIFNEKGQVSGAIVIFRDISKERELEKTREEFASLATHQLRNPITAIKGYSSLLLDESSGSITAGQRSELEAIQTANERLLELVNAMLNVSKIEMGKLAIEPEPTYIPDVADAAIKELLPQLEKKKLELKKQYPSDLPSINADSKLTRAIIQNLLTNAVNYTPKGGKITIDIQKQEPDVLIKVSDTGMGIPKEQQSKIFTKLFRADNARTQIPSGTGLGLYIVKAIVEQSGGKIWFESEENKGTIFYVTIPLSGMKREEGIKGLS